MEGLNQAEIKEIASLRQKASEMFRQVQVMFRTCFDGLMKNDIRTLDEVLDDEDKITKLYDSLTAVAVEISKKNLSEESKRTVLDLTDVISTIERIGDSCVGLVERIEYKIREKLLFSEEAVQEYKDLHNKVEKTILDTIELLKTEDKKLAKGILESKSILDALVDKYRASHIDRSARGICDTWARIRYLDMLDLTRDIAQHCMDIASKWA